MIISGKSFVTGVIGGNISGSLSPYIHNHWYKQYNINGFFVPFQTSADKFQKVAYGLFGGGIKGLNVTVPLKEEAFLFADMLTAEAKEAKAVNCLYWGDNNIIIGHNTDGIGFISSVRSLSPDFDFKNAQILVIGAGGAASGVMAGLKNQGVKKFSIVNRTYDNALNLASLMSDDNVKVNAYDKCGALSDRYDLIINTTTLKDIIPQGINDIPSHILNDTECVIDINYGFHPNNFLEKAKSHGCKVCDGLEMLIQQARPSFSLFNSCVIPDADDTLYKSLYKQMEL